MAKKFNVREGYENIYLDKAKYLYETHCLLWLFDFWVCDLNRNLSKEQLADIRGTCENIRKINLKDDTNKQIYEIFTKIYDGKVMEDYQSAECAFFMESEMRKIDVKDREQSINNLSHRCYLLSYIFDSIGHQDPILEPFENLKTFEKAAILTVQKVGEYIGYWTAKCETKRKNIASAKKKTENKNKRINELMKLMAEWKLNDDNKRKLVRKAMEYFDMSERTITNYLKEIGK